MPACTRPPRLAATSACTAQRSPGSARQSPPGWRALQNSRPDPLLDEGDLVDLAQRGDAGEDLLEGGVAEEGHALLAGGLLYLGRGAPLEDHLADAVGHVEELRHAGAPEEAGAPALLAPDGLEEG